MEYARAPRAACDLVPRVPGRVVPERACALCARSTPDVSQEPRKTSPSKEPVLKRVNREWSIAYEEPPDKVLHEISSDLDFLLNRTLESKAAILEEIEEAPT